MADAGMSPSAAEVEMQSRLAAIVESSTDAIFAKTLDGVITSWNAGAEHMYGYNAAEILGHNVSELVPADRMAELHPILDRTRRGERSEHLETKRLHKDGAILDVSVSVSPIRDANGDVVGASTVARDMTERNRAESNRRALEERLRQTERVESLGQLAGGIAHDFNNLLAIIVNYASVVAEEIADQPAALADVQAIQRAADRGIGLTRQLLTFARREALQPMALDVNAIVAEIRSLLSRSMGEHIEVRVERAADLPTILADHGQVEQVLLNLAVNARDAMPEGGTFTIETSRTELDESYHSLHPNVSPGQYVELTLSDTGTGMSPEVSSRIFEPFFTTKSLGQGTGLGLATAYGIVAEAGGNMNLYTEEGIGTTFRIYFPVSDVPAISKSTTQGEEPPQGKGEVILVAEDEPGVLEITSRILRQNNYIPFAAGTCEEALEFATTNDFALLLTDCVMPHMSGPALARRIDELRPGRAVLYMSGYSAGVLNSQQLLAEGLSFIQKPFTRRGLVEKVHAVLTTAAQSSRRSDP